MSPPERRRKERAAAPPVGRVRGADGNERDVYEDADGRQYVLGEQGEKVYGLWLLATSARPPAPREEKPPPEDGGDEAPWERPGVVRRDRERHRGRTLAVLGTLSFGLGIIGLLSGVLAVPGLGFGLYVRASARRDLSKMSAGEMDPAGALATEAALQDATLGLAFSALGLVVFSTLAVVLFFLFT
jgi:hypothetical protein